MISTFHLPKLNALLKDFYTLSHIRITVFDDTFQELTSYPQELAPICQIIRSDPKAYENCQICDKNACRIASRQHSTYTYQCHAGLTESIVPLYIHNIPIGYLLFGHVFSYQSQTEGWNCISEKCKAYDLDKNALKTACLELPLIPEDFIVSSSHIMEAVASYLCLEKMAVLTKEKLPAQIDEYISLHFTEELNAKKLCQHFGIGKTQLYEIAQENYGIGIAEHIRRLRIKKAQDMLIDLPELSIAEIASDCGFNDYNYFITVFKKLTGMPPQKYRNNIKQY